MVKKIDIRKEKNGYAVCVVNYDGKTALFHSYTNKNKSEIIKILDDLESRMDKEEWKVGDDYFFVSASGLIKFDNWINDDTNKDRLIMDNVFKTKQEAKNHKLRLESLTKQTAVEGEDFWIWNFNNRTAYNPTDCNSTGWDEFIMDIKHKTKEQAEEWGKKYDKVWRER